MPEDKDGNKLDFTEKVFFASVIFIYTLVSYKLFFFPIMNEDAMIAHMYVSKDIFFSNTLSTEVNSSYYTYHVQPTSMDLQYSWLYLVINEFDDIYPRFLILSHSILATAITYSLGKNITKSRKAGLLSCLLLVILISYPLNTIRPNKDISVAFYTLASFYYLYNNQGHKNNFLLFISGIFLGLALFTKYSAIPYYLSISIFLFFYYYHKSELSLDIDLLKERGPRFIREYSRIFFFITAGVLSIWAPFLIRNILIFGNPHKEQISRFH